MPRFTKMLEIIILLGLLVVFSCGAYSQFAAIRVIDAKDNEFRDELTRITLERPVRYVMINNNFSGGSTVNDGFVEPEGRIIYR